MSRIPLEDSFNDVIGKAQRGLGLSSAVLARQAGLAELDLRHLKAGMFDEEALRCVTRVLRLRADALIALALEEWYPPDVTVAGVAGFQSLYGGMPVNSYLIWDAATGTAAAFDAGTDCRELVAFAAAQNLKVSAIYLTHFHTDHIVALEPLKRATGAPAFVSAREPTPGAQPFPDGTAFNIGNLAVETRITTGHSRGGVTYVVRGLERLVAVVGDAIYAGSMGGGMVDYAEALRTTRDQILSLPDDTVLCPGHGPLTSVAEEKQHNPFFP